MIPTVFGLPTIWFTLVGILVTLAVICIAIDRGREALLAWRQRRARRLPPVYVLPRALAQPTSWRRGQWRAKDGGRP